MALSMAYGRMMYHIPVRILLQELFLAGIFISTFPSRFVIPYFFIDYGLVKIAAMPEEK